MFLQHLADQLSSGWGKSCSHVIMWIRCAWPLLLFEQLTFASMGYMCVGKVRQVLMMELASLMFHWSKLLL